MTTSRSPKKAKSSKTDTRLTVRLDDESKQFLAVAAALRHLSVGDYVKAVAVPQAQREVRAARETIVALTPEEQLSFWTALNKAPRLTVGQRRLGSMLRSGT